MVSVLDKLTDKPLVRKNVPFVAPPIWSTSPIANCASPQAIEELCTYPHIEEAAVLSTCNRMELYVVALSWHRGVAEVGFSSDLSLIGSCTVCSACAGPADTRLRRAVLLRVHRHAFVLHSAHKDA